MNETSSDETTDEEEVNRNFEAEAQLIVETDTLPKKSAERYLLVYETYKKWKQKNKNALSKSEECNLVVYFKELSTRLSPPTLWSVFSMLKTTLNTKNHIDISKFYKLKSLIKNNAKGYKPKKSYVLTSNEIVEFINKAPDHVYLASKVILIFGICGATRCEELKELKVADVEDLGGKYLVSINDTKNDVPRKFLIGDLFYESVKKYISLKPTDFQTERFFIQYHNGTCQRQVIGRNSIGLIPKSIASYLKLKNPSKYTGHCFRRTAATLLSNSGANTTMLKQLGGWKSSGIAEGYVENSLSNRQKIFDNITHSALSSAQLNPQPSSSKNSAADGLGFNKKEKSTQKDEDNFSEEFKIDDDTLAAIEKSVPPEKLESPILFSTTGNNRRILSSSNRESTHFMRKPPISVFKREGENEPPLKKNKTEETTTQKNELLSESTSTTNSTTGKNPSINYDNCSFYGNIINNFYYHNANDKNSEKKI